MNKSIYEKAIEDLYYVIPVGYPEDMIGKTIQTKRLLDFVKQAQKQGRLLELYKELITVKDELLSVAYFDDRCYNTGTVQTEIDLEKQIKELENELIYKRT